MFSDSVIDLVETGVITNKFKAIHNGRITTVLSTEPSVSLILFMIILRWSFTLRPDERHGIDPAERQNCCDQFRAGDRSDRASLRRLDRHRIFSGLAARWISFTGCAFQGRKTDHRDAVDSREGKGFKNCVETQDRSRRGYDEGHVHWVVTEYGKANLHGLSLRQRARP